MERPITTQCKDCDIWDECDIYDALEAIEDAILGSADAKHGLEILMESHGQWLECWEKVPKDGTTT